MLKIFGPAEVKTLASNQPTQPNPAQPKPLETGGPFQTFKVARLQGLHMIRISIIQSLYGRDLNNTFGNDFLFISPLDFDDPQLEAVGVDLAQAMRKCAPTWVNFLRYKIQELTANGKPVRGKFAGDTLNFKGQFAPANGDVKAPGYIVATIRKTPYFGLPGRLDLRHYLTASEVEDFTKTGTVPTRFLDKDDPLDALTYNFVEKLTNAVGTTGLVHALPDAYGDALVTPRMVKRFVFDTIRSSQENRPKESAMVAVYKAVQSQINEYAQEARFASRVDRNGAVPDGADVLVAQLKAKASAAYATLDAGQKSRINWPEIFDSNPLSGGV